MRMCQLRREAALNWLAVGLLLAAWNAADDGMESQPPRRPAALRGYALVSVRALQRLAPQKVDRAMKFFAKGHTTVNVL
jgi:hypothetical protein